MVDAFPRSIFFKTSEIVIDRSPGRKVVGHASPAYSSLQNIHDGTQDLIKVYTSRPSTWLGCWQVWRYALKLLLGLVGWVCFAFHTSKFAPFLTLFKQALKFGLLDAYMRAELANPTIRFA